MARYRIARDGHPYIAHGYPIVGKDGSTDTRFSTYQVYPRAEALFGLAGFRDGDQVPKETFYALLLDGDLYNEARPKGIKIGIVPTMTRLDAEGFEAQLHVLGFETIPEIGGAKFTLDIFRAIVSFKGEDKANSQGGRRFALTVASWLCILRRMRQELGR